MITADIEGGLEETETVSLSAATVTDIHEAQNEHEICVGFCIVNTDTNPLHVSIYRNTGGSDVMFWRKPVPAEDTLTETVIPRALRKGDKIKAQVGTVDVISITPIIFKLQ